MCFRFLWERGQADSFDARCWERCFLPHSIFTPYDNRTRNSRQTKTQAVIIQLLFSTFDVRIWVKLSLVKALGKLRNGGKNATYNRQPQNYGLIRFRQGKVIWVNFANIMTTQFITNQDKLLSDVVNNILPSAERLYFLVGYFYFSGFQEIYKQVTGGNSEMAEKLPVIIDNKGNNKVLQDLQKLLPKLQSMDIAISVFQIVSFL